MVPSLGKIESFLNVELFIFTMFFLGSITLVYDLELLVEYLEVLLNNIEWSFGLTGEKLICAGAVACWPPRTSSYFVYPVYWEYLFRPMGTPVTLEYNLPGILNVFVFEKICVLEQQGNENLTTFDYNYGG